MGSHSFFDIAGEVLVHRGRGSMLFGETKRFGKQPDMRFGGTNDRHRQLVAFDHHFSPRAHTRQNACELLAASASEM